MLSSLFVVFVVPALLLLWLLPASEVLALLRRRPSPEHGSIQARPRFLFLIPAHQEEELIGACVRSVLDMDYPASARAVVVIADNCRDETAKEARAAGARCLERWEPEHPGKPRALAWGLERLRQEGPEAWDACVVVDADSVVNRAFAARLALHVPLERKCVQTYFDLSNEEQSWLTRLASVLAKVRYERAYPLKRAAGLNCPLTGNGMCIGRELLASGWPAFSLTENWELYARFTAEGVPIEYEPAAHLYSQEASSLSQAGTQRKRWLAGRVSVLANYLGAILRSRKIGMHQKLDAIGELASFPPVLHGALVGGLVLASPFLAPSAWLAAAIPALALASLLPLATHSFDILRRHPARWKVAGCFLLLPAYAVWRLATAVLSVRTLKEGRWQKTERRTAAR